MKNARFILLIINILVIFPTLSKAQMPDPVKWTTTIEKEKSGQTVLVMTANIERGWHLYSQFLPDGGPIKTMFSLVPSADYELIGTVTEGKSTDYYDKNFEMQLKYFSEKTEFRQQIKLKTKKDFTINGNVEYMVCDDEKCLPPKTVDLTFNVKL